ncbi:MAG: helix-turn-helix transcriptional regulator [Clostridia bacterium]|nr:helix-turn-helix transcriptional regulator [Clostridia bacterium]
MQIEHFGLSRLTLSLLQNANGRTNHLKLGSPCNFFAMIEHGHARFSFAGGTVELAPRELLYIPRGLVYTSEWFGSPDCRFYSLAFSFRHASENARFALQKLQADTLAPEQIDLADFAVATAGEWQLLSFFYRVYGIVAPRLTPHPTDTRLGALYPALRQMEQSPATEVTVPELARLCGMSTSKFYDQFQKALDCTPMTYKNLLRAQHAVDLLTNTDLTVEEIAARLGCSSPSYLRRILAATVGKTPKEIRRDKPTL